jgi:hypothetical protein
MKAAKNRERGRQTPEQATQFAAGFVGKRRQ